MRLDAKQFLTRFFAESNERFDANETAVFARNLEVILSRTQEVLYAENKAFRLVPTSSIDPGAASYTYQQFDVAGEADFVDDYANDFPRAEIKGAEFSGKMKSLGSSYGYSIQDFRAARLAGLALEDRKARAAKLFVDNKIEEIATVGNSNHGLTGMTNAPNVDSLAATANWATGAATPVQIFNDVARLGRKTFDDTKGRLQSDTLLLPTNVFSYISSTQYDGTFTSETILQRIVKANPWIRNVEHWARLDTAGASSAPLVMAYRRDPMCVEMQVAVAFEQFAPQQRNMSFVIPCHARVGGVMFYYPKSAAYLTGAGG